MTTPSDAEIRLLAGRVGDRLLELGRRLVIAESCTGGWVAKACTDVAGSSRWFLGGVVAYDNAVKTGLLGVDPRTLAAEGAVSQAVVREMATGVLDRLGGEAALAVSGVAGPDGGQPGKPVGTVWFAWALRHDDRAEVRTGLEFFEGDREAVRRLAVASALRGLLET